MLVTVTAKDRAAEVAQVLQQNGGDLYRLRSPLRQPRPPGASRNATPINH